MKLELHKCVPAEVDEAVEWYEDQRPALGAEFLTAFKTHVAAILERPRTFGFWRGSRRVRRLKMRRFPYDILFWILPGRIRILSVRHVKRHPSCGARRY